MQGEQYNESIDHEENQSDSNHIQDFLDVSLEMPITTGDIHITNHNTNHIGNDKQMKRQRCKIFVRYISRAWCFLHISMQQLIIKRLV